jgi:NADH-quinone oxidoreductase subunit M
VAVASTGVILAAAYMLWMVQRVFYGEVRNPKNGSLPDLSLREAAVVAPLAALALFMGVASPLFTRPIEPSIDALIRRAREQGPAPQPVVPPRPAAGTTTVSARHERGPDRATAVPPSTWGRIGGAVDE